MKLNKKLLGIFLSLGFAISFCVATSAMENNGEERNIANDGGDKTAEDSTDSASDESDSNFKKRLLTGMAKGFRLLRGGAAVNVEIKYEDCLEKSKTDVKDYVYFMNTYIILKKILTGAGLFNEKISKNIFCNLFNIKYKDDNYTHNVVSFDSCDIKELNEIKSAIEKAKLKDIKIFKDDLEDAKKDFKDFMEYNSKTKRMEIDDIAKIKDRLSLLKAHCSNIELARKRLETLKNDFKVDRAIVKYIIECFDEYIKLLKEDIESLEKENSTSKIVDESDNNELTKSSTLKIVDESDNNELTRNNTLKIVDESDIKELTRILKDNKLSKINTMLKDVERMDCCLKNCFDFEKFGFKDAFCALNEYITLKC